MKKLIVLFLLSASLSFMSASDPSDLVVINNPFGTPGSEINIDFCIEFYDLTGKKLTLEYTIDPLTGAIIVKGGTGTVIISVTNKKTKEKKTSKVVFVSAG